MQEPGLNPVDDHPDRLIFRNIVRRFGSREIAPHTRDRRGAGGFPRALNARGADAGLPGVPFAELNRAADDIDAYHRRVLILGRAQCDSGGLVESCTPQICADDTVRTLGSMRDVRGTCANRSCAEGEVSTVGGGAEEVMQELAACRLGL